MIQSIKKSNYFVLTGAMGAGKSTILTALNERKFRCVEEPARPIIAEQRDIGGEGVYEKDTKLFIELMLSRAIFQFKQMRDYHGPVIFDRGIPDMIGYANIADLTLAHAQKASEKYRYNGVVFLASGWEAIYQTDDERKMSFEAAKNFGDNIREIYLSLGYEIVDVPFDTPERRAEFIINTIANR